MKFLGCTALFLIAVAIGFATALLGAQFVVWGLSIMHVNSGIWGPYLILSGTSMVITTSVTLNSRSQR